MQVRQVRTIISVININWNGFHSLSNIFIQSAKKKTIFWQTLANSGTFWQTLANFGKHFFWQTQKKGNILPYPPPPPPPPPPPKHNELF